MSDLHSDYLRYLTARGAMDRYPEFIPDEEWVKIEHVLPDDDPSVVLWRRLDHELDVIIKAGFPAYFLIVSDLMAFCRRSGIPVGPGRGSVCGSAVAYALGITDVEPIRFGIPFERFLHLERIAPPDIDSDICQQRRGEAIEYLRQKYGRDAVAQIITFGTMMAKGAVKDVCRVLHVDDILYGKRSNETGEKLAAMIPDGSGADQVKLDDFLEQDERFRTAIERLVIPFDGDDISVLDTVKRLEGLRRHGSVHAAGVVIGDRPLIDLAPLYKKNQDAEVQIQFDYRDAEDIGLLKLDVLGLRTVTVIGDAERGIRRHDPGFDIRNVPLDDAATFKLLQDGDTVGVFQLEGEGITAAIRGIKPDRFDDIIATIALYRPGPMEQLGSYIDRKHGKEDVSFDHPDLRPILERSYGLIVYQEQVMGIAQVLAGYTPGEGDLFRKAIGKKLPELIREEIGKFSKRAIDRGYDPDLVERIGNQIAYFGRYGFNLGHATGYAFLTYWTAWLKANTPVEFYAGNLNSYLGELDRIAVFMSDAKKHGVRIRPPDINRSGRGFVVHDGEALFGLEAIKGVGSAYVQDILEERDSREKNKRSRVRVQRSKPDGTEYMASVQQIDRVRNDPRPYEDFYDFCRRLTHVPINVKTFLIQAGAFDSGDLDERAALLEAAEHINKLAKKGTRPAGPPKPVQVSRIEMLKMERETMGFYVSDHPLALYEHELRRYGAVVDGSFDQLHGKCVIAGIVTEVRLHPSKNGEMAWVSLETGIRDLPDVTFFNEAWAQHQDIIKKNEVLIIAADKKHHAKFGWNLVALAASPIDLARPRASKLLLTLPGADIDVLMGVFDQTSDEGLRMNLAIEDMSGRVALLATERKVLLSGHTVQLLEQYGDVFYDYSSSRPMPWNGGYLKKSESVHRGSGSGRQAVWDLPMVKLAVKMFGGHVLAEYE